MIKLICGLAILFGFFLFLVGWKITLVVLVLMVAVALIIVGVAEVEDNERTHPLA